MFHYQLVNTCVCLQFGAEWEVYGGFLELSSWKQLPAVSDNNTMGALRLNHNSGAVGKIAKQWVEPQCKASVKARGAADLGHRPTPCASTHPDISQIVTLFFIVIVHITYKSICLYAFILFSIFMLMCN